MLFLKFTKKLTAYICAASLAVCFTGCSKDTDDQKAADKPCEILLVTDYGTVSDGSYNQGCWEGMEKYSEETGVVIDNYQPENTTEEAFLDQVKRGVKNGAKIVICPGGLLEEAVFDAQSKYPDTTFILLDGEPHNADYSDETIGTNVKSVLFAEEQAGFLAGYAAVREGYTGLGFMGGIANDSVIRYGYGFVQGADYAAIEMGVETHIRYAYMNTFNDDPIVETTAGAWFDDDTEVIFACGGSLGKGVMRAAEGHDGKVIGVDVDQSQESETVITSATKSLSDAVYECLEDYYNGTFVGGSVDNLTAKENGICLPLATSRFEKFTEDDYNSVYDRLVSGMITPYDGTEIATTQELTLINTNVTYIVME